VVGQKELEESHAEVLTQGTQAVTLCRNLYDFGRASALEQTSAEKPCRTRRISVELPRSSYDEGS
jgi:hypothetical protein